MPLSFTVAVSTATANLASAEAQLDEAKAQGARIFKLEEKGLVSLSPWSAAT